MNIELMTTIHVTGVQEPAGRKVDALRVVGIRDGDLIGRMVEVTLSVHDAEDLIRHATKEKRFPSIEVPFKSWVYVAQLGDTKFLFIKPKGETS